jgi:ABC-type transporter Mla subunit MlaD
MRRLVQIPARVGRYLWRFVDPPLKAGRVPLGRLAIITQIIVALAFVGYTLSKKSIRLPLASEPYEVQIIFPDAKGLDRLDEPAAAVAGTPVGRVTHVEYTDGRALATLTLDGEMEGKIFADATAAIRPASALQNLLVNIDPGTPAKGELTEPIPPWRTTSYVAIDELTSILDADTQAYATILIEQLEVALRDREVPLRQALGKLGGLVDTATPVAGALADRRRLLTRLVGELAVVAETLGDRGVQLGQAVNAGNQTLSVTAAREVELAAATRALGGVLEQADAAIGGLADVSRPLLPALDELVPAAPDLAESIVAMREFVPRGEGLIDRFETLVEAGEEPLKLLTDGTRGIGERAEQIIPGAEDLRALARRLDVYKRGMRQTADVLSGTFSAQDRGGAYGQVSFINIEPLRPENFGFPEDTSTEAFERRVARAFELACLTENPLACLFRFGIPGLPEEPVTGGRR